ncbi:sensor histidine kinase [Sporolituus thermophilus]|uniref:histidine kinase n=1 Tax=Sporolituus thermophilus DSM 23256 TaxID=1123285 RepID=A0A1G7ISU8_9FIRM|nr:ATP-binding protein [Sporolituus thermophilus]SDF15747.1 His Kinase A (phospho-acceptor) domain-containing protein [Sporolituus thermophilus DSM 23256]
MFQRTLRRLSVINSVVFLLIFLTFGAVLYGYVSYRLFDKVDDAMRFKAESFKITNGRVANPGRGRFLFDPRIIILLRDAQGRVTNIFSSEVADLERLTALASQVNTDEIQIREFENHAYRIISLPYRYEENVLQTERGPIAVKDVIAVSIVDSEVALLRNLFMIIISGLIMGMIIIILAGYYLARRAMVPIQAAWEKQQQFVADASHELRTPLAVIKSNAELMLRHPDHTIEEESIRVTNIVREVRRMTKLVADLLTLARADANQAELQLELVNLNELVASVAEQFGPLAELEGHMLRVAMAEELKLTGDRERLYQLLVILLDNAVKYTPPPGHILITGAKQGGHILVTVEDSGQGIPPEDLPRVFDRFYRGDKARSREKGGTGLGLAIAKWIVEKHGGKIGVESTVGAGTKFSILLPVKWIKRNSF